MRSRASCTRDADRSRRRLTPARPSTLHVGSVTRPDQSMLAPTRTRRRLWFKSTATSGGQLFGFGSSTTTALSGSYDRHVYMLNNGKLAFGVVQRGAEHRRRPPGLQRRSVAPRGRHPGRRMDAAVRRQPAGGSNASTTARTTPVPGGSVVTGSWSGRHQQLRQRHLRRVRCLSVGALPMAAVERTTMHGCWPATGQPARQQPPSPHSRRPTWTSRWTASASKDLDGTIASYAWNFGDGDTGTGASRPPTRYTAAGPYTVKLTVADDRTDTGNDFAACHGGRQPDPDRSLHHHRRPSSTWPSTPATSTDADGTISSYAWDFGDGSTGTGKTTQHAYDAAGHYTVTLTVTDNSGTTTASTSRLSRCRGQPSAHCDASLTDVDQLRRSRSTPVPPAIRRRHDRAHLRVGLR